MILWFVSTAVLTVWFVFRDPRFDYRLLIVGSVLPDLDGLFGGAGVMHSVLFSVLLLAAVMVGTAGRKPVRRLLLGLPIGTFLHLVFDGAPLPEAARGWWDVVLELVGLAVLVWVWRSSRLSEPAARRQFLRDGRLFTGAA